ncbi:hypothetical protein MBGDF03_00976 [Thermoplasmatales archaeon SCGC AB-540-F20]|nr:hypothetical protein MBGDF03_00976 [Thermoplasmatales archaeon SCGC AB-540-F20]
MKEYIQKLWKKPHLANILYFLEIFQYQGEGIEQKHLRFFLMKSHNLEFDREMYGFYDRHKKLFETFAPRRDAYRTSGDMGGNLIKFEEIEDEVEQEILKRKFILNLWRTGDIKAVGDLDQYLRRLCLNGVIKKLNRKKPFHYVTTIEYEKNFQELRILEFIERWDFKERDVVSICKIEGHCYDSSIFGASREIFTKEETNRIGKHLEVICDNLGEILELKKQKILHLLKEADEVDKAKLSSIDFFFHGSLV